jgi:hypothetical protein
MASELGNSFVAFHGLAVPFRAIGRAEALPRMRDGRDVPADRPAGSYRRERAFSGS